MIWEYAIWAFLVAALHLALVVSVTFHAVLWKRDVRSVISWVGLVWLTPFVGSFLYFCFGINRLHRKAIKLNVPKNLQLPDHSFDDGEFLDETESQISERPNLRGLERTGANLTGLPLLPGNEVKPLVDGDEAFPAMLAAIKGAQRSISLQSYIFDHDRVGKQFQDALCVAQKRGVEIRILIDGVGSSYSRPNMIRELRRAGIRVAAFLPTMLPRLPNTANLRNHRKILVVDGIKGFTGGTNIREGHTLGLNPRFPVRCLHFEISGPVVAQMQRTFALDWAFTTGEQLTGDAWFPNPTSSGVGSIWARSVQHGPDEDFRKLSELILGAISIAEREIVVFTPYFLPNNSLIDALNVAALRGVRVRIYLPESNNIAVVQWACMAQLWQILEKGCRVFLTPRPFDHTKLFLIDSAWALIGSANWDPRSLRLNFEFNIECYGESLIQPLETIVESKAESAREITLAEVNQRPFPIRIRDGVARLLMPYL
ncbi:MAG: cardiolipin synthase [Pirellulaceae bacterium]